MSDKQTPAEKPQSPAGQSPKHEPVKPPPPDIVMVKGSYTGTKYFGPPLDAPPQGPTVPPNGSG